MPLFAPVMRMTLDMARNKSRVSVIAQLGMVARVVIDAQTITSTARYIKHPLKLLYRSAIWFPRKADNMWM